MRGHDLNHRPEDETRRVFSADITASILYWQRTERRFEPLAARAVTKWAMCAVSACDDGMSGPRRPRTHMLFANPDWWDLMQISCCDICPTRCTIRRMTSPIGVCARAGGCGQKTTPRVDCAALTLRLWCMWCYTVLPLPPRCGQHCCPLNGRAWPEPRRH